MPNKRWGARRHLILIGYYPDVKQMINFYRSSNRYLLYQASFFIFGFPTWSASLIMVKTEKHIFRRFLLYIMLISGLMTGQSAIVQASSPLKAGKTVCVERLFDHEKIHIPYIDNGSNQVEEENDLQLVLATKKIPRKKRYYINSTYQSSSYTTRLQQFQYNHEFYIPVRENKTGVYMQQHAFLPAYYSFLSRYTPF